MLNRIYVRDYLLGVTPMNGIKKVIDELGLIILTKEIEIESKQEEINALKRKIELVEQYLDTYEQFYNKENK